MSGKVSRAAKSKTKAKTKAKIETKTQSKAAAKSAPKSTAKAKVDPITLSVSRQAGQSVALPYAAAVILIAGGANLVCKNALAIALGSREFAIYLTAAALAVGVSATMLWLVLG